MKIAYRLIQVIGDGAWVDSTIERSLHGASAILPGQRFIRTHELGEREITAFELIDIGADATPPETAGGSAVRVEGDDPR